MKIALPIIALALVIIVIAGLGIARQRMKTTDVVNPPVTQEGASEMNNPTGNSSTGKNTSPTDSSMKSGGQITLTISSPANGETVHLPNLTVKGNTDPRAEVFINDKETTADARGDFAVTMTLDEGENIVSIAANDAEGNGVEQELIVTYDVGQ